MKAYARHIVVALVVALVTVVIPARAFAGSGGDGDDGGMAVVCGEDQQQQVSCATIVWSGGAAGEAAAATAAAELTVWEFAAVWYFAIGSWAVWDAMFSEHWDVPICTNCHEVWQANGGGTRIVT